MMSDPVHRPQRRIRLTLLFVGALLLAGLTAVVIVISGIAYRPEWVTVGPAEEFPPADAPYRIIEGEFTAWLVSTDAGFIAIHDKSPASQCFYKWAPSNGRFEDPCCGGKWTLEGMLIEGPDVATDLWRYPFEIEDGLIRINTSDIIYPGDPEAAEVPCLG